MGWASAGTSSAKALAGTSTFISTWVRTALRSTVPDGWVRRIRTWRDPPDAGVS